MNVKNLSEQMQMLAKKGVSDTSASAYFRLDDQVKFQEKKVLELKKKLEDGKFTLGFKDLNLTTSQLKEAEKYLLQLKDAREKAH